MLPDLTTLPTAIAALGAVLALIWIAARAARIGGWKAPPVAGRMLAIEEVLALDARRRLCLIRCGERKLLILTGGDGAMLGWLPEQGGAK